MPTHLVCLFAVWAASTGNLLQNAEFSAGAEGWEFSSADIAHGAEKFAERDSLFLEVRQEDEVSFYHFRQSFETKPGDVLEFSAWARGDSIRDGHGVYASVSFFAEDGQRIAFEQTMPVLENADWHEISARCITPPGTAKAHLALLLHGRGRAWFDRASVRKIGHLDTTTPEGAVTLAVQETPLPDKLIGFGAEDDGWLFNTDNAQAVDAAAVALYNRRLEWMQPDWVRMFVWYKDFNPEEDWRTFDWGTDNMESRHKTLEVYQRLGTAVNVTGVEWGMKAPFDDSQGLASAVGALLEHLIRDKGFTCVKYWTLTNEPNTHFLRRGATFEDYVEMHRLVKAEIRRRGLDVQIIGSDDTNGGFGWFKRCVETPAYMDAVDVFASHRYFKSHETPLAAHFFDERIALLQERKPFTVAEFGFQDERSGTLENPIMESYPYAIWAAAFAIDGLNRGVSGFTIWCLHEVLYPNQWRMTYGLWNYADRDWEVRPVYHAWAMFTRNTKAGGTVRPIASSHPAQVLATKVDETIFWVNQSATDLDVRFEGIAAKMAHVHTEDTLYGDAECGYKIPNTNGKLKLPAMSFGYLE